jgi:hypothetical protein
MIPPSDEFDDLESRLRRVLADTPSPVLRDRVMLAVAGELRTAQNSGWSWLPLLAVTLVMGLTLGRIAATVTTFMVTEKTPAAPVYANAEAIERLSPQISEREATRSALVLSAANSVPLIPLPEVKAPTRIAQ